MCFISRLVKKNGCWTAHSALAQASYIHSAYTKPIFSQMYMVNLAVRLPRQIKKSDCAQRYHSVHHYDEMGKICALSHLSRTSHNACTHDANLELSAKYTFACSSLITLWSCACIRYAMLPMVMK